MRNISEDGNTITLHKFTGLDPCARKKQDGDILSCVIDVETTGLGDTDRVIQLSVRPFYYCPESFEVTGIVKPMMFFQYPGEDLRPEIIELTGITDEQVKGQTIDWSWIRSMFERCKFVITHNAKFDRGAIDREFSRAEIPVTEKAIWACSVKQIEWRSWCRPSAALEVLCAWSGFFYDAHRADVDTAALLHLLRRENRLKELLTNASKPEYRVYAGGFPRDLNSDLKRRWYSWDANLKVWYKSVDGQEAVDEEVTWLKQRAPSCDPQTLEIPPEQRFSTEA
jgi:DNA polymerase-3 subunit epsilon